MLIAAVPNQPTDLCGGRQASITTFDAKNLIHTAIFDPHVCTLPQLTSMTCCPFIKNKLWCNITLTVVGSLLFGVLMAIIIFKFF